MKKIIALLLCCTCIALSGCSVEVGDMESEYLTSSFDGVWRQIDCDPNEYLEATVSGDYIEIRVVSKTENITGVYWYGTIPTFSEPVKDLQWMSSSDLSKIDYSFLTVTDNKKHFMYKDGYLWFPYYMSDFSLIMRLERVEE